MPRENGQATITEIMIECMIEEHGKAGELDFLAIIEEVQKLLGHYPTWQEVTEHLAERYGLVEKRDKPWPIEEDCQGCDQHKDGPHRFGCSLRGVRQLVVYANQTPDGKFQVTYPIGHDDGNPGTDA